MKQHILSKIGSMKDGIENSQFQNKHNKISRHFETDLKLKTNYMNPEKQAKELTQEEVYKNRLAEKVSGRYTKVLDNVTNI